jgi:hypothetical protein
MKMPIVGFAWLAPVAVLISVLVVPATYAAPEADDTRVTSASGSLAIVASVPQKREVVDGQLLFQVRNTINFTGTLTGTSLCVTLGRVNLSTGQGSFSCHGAFSGTVAGISGTYLIRVAGTLNGPVAQGRLVITSSTDGESGEDHLVGQLSFVQNSNCGPFGCTAGPYTGQIHLTD